MTIQTQRFLATTRGRVLVLLRRGPASVNDLAGELGLTSNAIRAHLAALEHDQLVRRAGQRASARRPEVLYALTDEAEGLFPKAYPLLLNLVLDAVGQREPPEAVERLLRDVGRAAAAAQPGAHGRESLRARAEVGVRAIGDLGGVAKLEKSGDGFVIRGYACPIAAVVQRHPQVCRLVETLLSEAIGAPVRETCDRVGVPRCVFAVGPAAMA